MEKVDFVPDPSLTEVIREADAKGLDVAGKSTAFHYSLGRKAFLKGIPINGMFELIPFCNLDCKMCYVHLNKDQMKGRQFLDGKAWIDIIDQACDAGMIIARLTGGECLSHPDFWDIYEHLCTRGVEIVLLTNGVLLTESTIEKLEKRKPKKIQITVYGNDDDAYERVTGHRVFHQVKKAIERTLAAEIPVALMMTPSRYLSREESVKLVDFLHSLGISYGINGTLIEARQDTGREIGEYDVLPEDYFYLVKYEATKKGYTISPISDECFPEVGSDQGTPTAGIQCGAGRNAFHISWEGMMYGCGVLRDIYASVLDLGFTAAWKSVNKAACEYPLPIECQGCSVKSICKICVAEHRRGAEVGHTNPAICGWLRRMVVDGLYSLPEGV